MWESKKSWRNMECVRGILLESQAGFASGLFIGVLASGSSERKKKDKRIHFFQKIQKKFVNYIQNTKKYQKINHIFFNILQKVFDNNGPKIAFCFNKKKSYMQINF